MGFSATVSSGYGAGNPETTWLRFGKEMEALAEFSGRSDRVTNARKIVVGEAIPHLLFKQVVIKVEAFGYPPPLCTMKTLPDLFQLASQVHCPPSGSMDNHLAQSSATGGDELS